MDVDRVSRRTTGTPASPPTESLLLPPGAENDDLFISKTNHGWRMVKIYDIQEKDCGPNTTLYHDVIYVYVDL